MAGFVEEEAEQNILLLKNKTCIGTKNYLFHFINRF
jgi:hypothetical protein